jgi:hypothetical protein
LEKVNKTENARYISPRVGVLSRRRLRKNSRIAEPRQFCIAKEHLTNLSLCDLRGFFSNLFEARLSLVERKRPNSLCGGPACLVCFASLGETARERFRTDHCIGPTTPVIGMAL